jgi:hypothetical protein
MITETPITDAVAKGDGGKFYEIEIVEADAMRRVERVLHTLAASLKQSPHGELCIGGDRGPCNCHKFALSTYRALLPANQTNPKI